MSKHNRGRPRHLFDLEDLFSHSFLLSFLLFHWLNSLLKVLHLLGELLKQLLGFSGRRRKQRLLEAHVFQLLKFLQAHRFLAIGHDQKDLGVHDEVLVVLNCSKVLSAVEHLAALIKLRLLQVSHVCGKLALRWRGC